MDKGAAAEAEDWLSLQLAEVSRLMDASYPGR